VKAREKIDRYSKSFVTSEKQKNHCHSPEMRQDQKNKNKTRGTQNGEPPLPYERARVLYLSVPGEFRHTRHRLCRAKKEIAMCWYGAPMFKKNR